MNKDKPIACVTGASGMVGRAVVKLLLASGSFRVRVLSRVEGFELQGTDIFHGGLEHDGVLVDFLENAEVLYHCAAELRDESRMWDVNVLGTGRLLKYAATSKVRHLCHISSAGVVGSSTRSWVDEEHPCAPRNMYEKSKLAAEQLVAQGMAGCSIVILRPTNVIDDLHTGVLELPVGKSLRNNILRFVKGGECAHIVHADDVAAAALFLTGKKFEKPECFFVSCDHEPFNTLAELWSLLVQARNGHPAQQARPALHLPLVIPYLARMLFRGHSNRGDVRYSSKKLCAMGFTFPLGITGAVRRITVNLEGSA